MPRVVHFEINVDEPDRAVRFYTEVFGWTIEKWNGASDYWMISTGRNEPGIDGALMRRMTPTTSTINTISVPSVDDYVNKIEEHGGRVVMPKTAIHGVGYVAYCQDSEGNTFGIMQDDPTAQ